ncbi:hypothetical protein FOF44_16595 [Vibrio algivorus]|uniref:Uncharacterized protein n=1 Tax=Vibrio algivorus TaxID=1667024 RepID=A0A557NVW4_9VIBR|nr:hypothetical protein FOF44_16595 [Vibrio algivorus]
MDLYNATSLTRSTQPYGSNELEVKTFSKRFAKKVLKKCLTRTFKSLKWPPCSTRRAKRFQ